MDEFSFLNSSNHSNDIMINLTPKTSHNNSSFRSTSSLNIFSFHPNISESSGFHSGRTNNLMPSDDIFSPFSPNKHSSTKLFSSQSTKSRFNLKLRENSVSQISSDGSIMRLSNSDIFPNNLTNPGKSEFSSFEGSSKAFNYNKVNTTEQRSSDRKVYSIESSSKYDLPSSNSDIFSINLTNPGKSVISFENNKSVSNYNRNNMRENQEKSKLKHFKVDNDSVTFGISPDLFENCTNSSVNITDFDESISMSIEEINITSSSEDMLEAISSNSTDMSDTTIGQEDTFKNKSHSLNKFNSILPIESPDMFASIPSNNIDDVIESNILSITSPDMFDSTTSNYIDDVIKSDIYQHRLKKCKSILPIASPDMFGSTSSTPDINKHKSDKTHNNLLVSNVSPDMFANDSNSSIISDDQKSYHLDNTKINENSQKSMISLYEIKSSATNKTDNNDISIKRSTLDPIVRTQIQGNPNSATENVCVMDTENDEKIISNKRSIISSKQNPKKATNLINWEKNIVPIDRPLLDVNKKTDTMKNNSKTYNERATLKTRCTRDITSTELNKNAVGTEIESVKIFGNKLNERLVERSNDNSEKNISAELSANRNMFVLDNSKKADRSSKVVCVGDNKNKANKEIVSTRDNHIRNKKIDKQITKVIRNPQSVKSHSHTTFCTTVEKRFSNNIPDNYQLLYRAAQNCDVNIASELVTENVPKFQQFNFDNVQQQCFPSDLTLNHCENKTKRQQLIRKIEELVLDMLNKLSIGKPIELKIENFKNNSSYSYDDCRTSQSKSSLKTIRKTSRIAFILYIISKIYKLLMTNTTVTKRELYYNDPELTQSTHNIDSAIKDIGAMLNASPWELGILSSSKGLIAGALKIILPDDKIIDCHNVDGVEGILLPHFTCGIKDIESNAAFVLIVEKDTVFKKLLQENILKVLGVNLILITGKGYPDINTRLILKRIWDKYQCPIYALVDADPFGIEIMLTYRHGSMSMSFSADQLAVPSIKWIGVYPSEIKRLNLAARQMNKEDNNRLKSIIKRPYVSTNLFKELLVLQNGLYKSEIESLSLNSARYLTQTYIPQKLNVHLNI